MKPKQTYHLDKWMLCAICPEMTHTFAIGNVTRHPHHPNQSKIHTGIIIDLVEGKDAFIAHTSNSTYLLPYANALMPYHPKGGETL